MSEYGGLKINSRFEITLDGYVVDKGTKDVLPGQMCLDDCVEQLNDFHTQLNELTAKLEAAEKEIAKRDAVMLGMAKEIEELRSEGDE